MNQTTRHIEVTPWALFIFYLLGCSPSAPQEGTVATPAPMTYYVAIDISGSMQEGALHKWRHVLLKRLVEEAMNSRDRLVVYSYGPYCKTEYNGYARWEDVAPLAEKYFTGKISRERGTNPALPLEMICNSVPENTRFAIVLITDGETADLKRMQEVLKKLSETRDLVAILAGPLNSDLNLRDPFAECFKAFNEPKPRFFHFGNQADDRESAIQSFISAISSSDATTSLAQ